MAKYPTPKKAAAKSSDSYDADANFREVKGERRIKDVDAARSIYNRLKTDNLLRSATFAQVRGQLEGNRPFDPAVQEEQGMAGNCNVNFRDSEAARDRTLLPYWKMVNDVPHRIAVTVQTASPHADTWASAFAECFDEFLDDWGAEYFNEYMNLAENFVNFGPGIPHWADKDSPRWKSANVTRILWPKNARMAPEEWEVFALVKDTSLSDLYGKVRTKAKREASKYAGWNLKAIEETIVNFKDGNPQDPKDYTRWQDNLVNNDIAVSTPFEPLPLIWLYVKQFDGNWGCYVFTESGVDDFLFVNEKYEDDVRRIIGPIWYNTGTDSMIHSIKGFAVKNYYFSSLLNRTKSRIIDCGTMGMALNFQRADGIPPDESPPIENYGGVNILAPGLTQVPVYAPYQGGKVLIDMLENNANNNNSLYREQQQQIEQTDTATQAKILAAMQSETSSASASIYLSQVGENIFTEQVRRLRRKGNTDRDAKAFVERMKALGVPDEVIHETRIRVKTGAHAGLANPAVRAQKFQQGLALRNMPGVNVQWFLKNLLATEYGANAVKPGQALLAEGQGSMPSQRREAKIENNMFGQGQPLEVAPEDAHFEHLEEHLEPLKNLAGLAQGGQPLGPEQMMALTIGVEHSSMHMQYLSQDETMKEQFMQLRPLFSQISSVARGILMQQQKMQQMAQSQPMTG